MPQKKLGHLWGQRSLKEHISPPKRGTLDATVLVERPQRCLRRGRVFGTADTGVGAGHWDGHGLSL